MKKLLWPIVVCVAVALGFWGVKLYNDYCAKRQAYIQAYIAAKRDMTKYSVTTTPSGATVYIDGKKMGITPIEGKEIVRGNHEVKLSKEGYEDKVFTYTFGDNPVALSETLTEKPMLQTQSSPSHQQQQQPAKPQQPVKEESVVPTTTEFYVTTTPSGATVHVDGKKVGTTPIEGKEIAHGSHKVRISKDGYKDTTFMRTFGNKAVMLNVMLTDNPKPQSQTQQIQQTVIPSSSSPNPSDAIGKINGHEYVDLGLSVKWATCNVGAASPSDYGDYYAWGEIGTKSDYADETYKFYNKGEYTNIGEDISGTRYDAAHINWGGTWRLPTIGEFLELIEKCTWIWTSQGDHNGYKVTGENGKSIFLPAASFRRDSLPYFVGGYGYYWSATLNENNALEAGCLTFSSSGNHDLYWTIRSYGRSVRPVTD